jgi:hypothetical protein
MSAQAAAAALAHLTLGASALGHADAVGLVAQLRGGVGDADGDAQAQRAYELTSLLLGCPAAADTAVEAGALDAVAAALRALPAHPRLQRHGCELLTMLAVFSPACTARGIASGAVDAAVAALTAHGLTDPDILHAACEVLLRNRHGDDGAGGAMTDRFASVVESAAAALGAHVASAHAARSACSLLGHASALRADVAARVATSGFVEAAARLMWVHLADARLVEAAVSALVVLCCMHPDSCGELHASGAAAATVAALRMHAASKEMSRFCCTLLSALRNGDAALLAPLGVLDALVAALVAHPGDAELAGFCCPTLAFACQDCAHNQACALRSGALPALAAVIIAHPGVTELQQNAANALVSICMGTVAKTALSAAATEAVREAALAVLQRPGASAELSNPCVVLLMCVSRTPAGRRCTVTAGGLEAVAAAMHTHPTDRVLQSNGCCAVGSMCAVDADLKLRGGAAGAVEAVVTALTMPQPHEITAVLAVQACVALTNLAKNVVNGGRAIAAGALPAIVAAMGALDADAEVQHLGAMALHSIVSGMPERGLAAFAAGAIPALLAAMRSHPGAAGVQEHACNALSFLAGALPRAAAAAVSGGALPLIAAALRTHAAEREIQHDGCAAVASICGGNEAHIIEAGAAGAVEAVVAALRVQAWQADHRMQNALLVLCHTVGVPANAARAHAGGAVQLAVAAARAHAAHVHIVQYACDAVCVLTTQHAPCFDVAADCGVIELAVEALLSFTDADGAHSALHHSGLRMLHCVIHSNEMHAVRAVRAGALELGRPLPAEPALNDLAVRVRHERAMLMTVLRAAVERHDAASAACGAAAGDCRRCSTLRADGVLCSLAGCGARHRTGDPAGEGAGRRLLRCASCRHAAYCSAHHQRDDWRRHKAECGAMQLQREQLDAAQ